MTGADDDALAGARTLLFGWLTRAMSGRGGRAESFEALCLAHPHVANELKKVRAEIEASLGAMTLAERVGASIGDGIDPRVDLERGARDAEPDGSIPAREGSRYRIDGMLAQGGMGSILKVFDADLRRVLAMKVAGDASASLDGEKGKPPPVDRRVLSRFLEEAQVTAQLDHPGIVPVHELGLDGSGRVFFTMKLVKGRDLRAIYEAVFAGEEGWSETRTLGVLLRVCEAMAYAHKKGVIHRDLKPPNVMVGSFGEVYVMDWGLAKVLGRDDRKDVRIAPEGATTTTQRSVQSQRRDERDSDPSSPLFTMDGDVVGTPAYMPPEQARGEVEKLSPRSDVYAIGAMLYHLLAREMPFVPDSARLSARTILMRVVEGPPRPLAQLRTDVPAELVSICEKAMARDPAARYADTLELAEDLRAYLENRVVKAHRTGGLVELKKWVQRHKELAASLATALLVALALSAWAWIERGRARVESTRADANARRADSKATEAEARARDATARKAEFDQLAGFVLLENAMRTELGLYPAWPEKIDAIEAWLAGDARRLLELKPGIASTIADLTSRAMAPGEGEAGTLDFPDESQRFLYDTLGELAKKIDAFASGTRADVERRLAWATRIGDLTLHHPNARVSWEDARAAIAKADGVVASTLYREQPIDLKPQTGLVPIGMNPVTKLWEFYELRSACHVQAGEDPATIAIPAHADDGTIAVADDSGIVFVLIPGGTFWQGAQQTDESKPNFDPGAQSHETPQQVTLAPFFLAGHEMTRGQWKRLTGETPSLARNGVLIPGDSIKLGWTHPVESVSWDDCERWLGLHGLVLPTEARWEYAARGTTTTPWWTGADESSLGGAANVFDPLGKTSFSFLGKLMGSFPDGFSGPAPVGRFRANPFGLFDIHGNVWEWSADVYGGRYTDMTPRPGDGLRTPQPSAASANYRVPRGGWYGSSADESRSAMRGLNYPSFRASAFGVRAARELDP